MCASICGPRGVAFAAFRSGRHLRDLQYDLVMRMVVIGAVICAARLAAAGPVNLLTVVPTTVAVSSTVANKSILPRHLVDGDLTTAWNSRTDDLAGAWMAVRVPADASVTSVKLTVGFTKTDKTLGDLFVENPRIKRVRVTHDKTVVDKTLDVGNRGLQEIAIAGGGGDYKIEIVEVEPGTKKTWRETCVSELEVWGTTPSPAAKPLVPTVQIGSLEPVTPDDCLHAMFPAATSNKLGDDDVIGTIDVYAAGNDRYLCHMRHGAHPDAADAGTRTHELAVVTVKHQLLGGRAREETHGGQETDGPFGQTNSMNVDTGDVTVTPLALTSGETAFEVDVNQSVGGPMLGDDRTSSTIYRVTQAGLVAVLVFKSWSSDGESSDSDRCKLAIGRFPATGKQTLPDLDLNCVTESGRFHGERANEIEDKDRVEHYRWRGTKYVKR